MSIGNRLVQFKDFAAAVIGFIKRHTGPSITVAVALLIAGPLLTGSGGGAFFLNLVGLGIIALVVLRIVRTIDRRKAAQARQASCRCHCHRQQTQQQTGNQQAKGGTP